MKKFIVLMGPPAIGKSTWVKQNVDLARAIVISRDQIVESVAQKAGLTYNDLFNRNRPNLEALFLYDQNIWLLLTIYDNIIARLNGQVYDILRDTAKGAVLSDKDILVDATHMFLKHRRQSLNIIKGMEGEYEKIVVRFTFDGIKSKLIKSANLRKLETGKSIQQELFDKMYNNFTEPTLAEGFDKIIRIDPVWLHI